MNCLYIAFWTSKSVCSHTMDTDHLLSTCPATCRLTQPMGIDFDKQAPAVVLPEGLMCPFNSQNTLFDQKALWGTLIPITTSFRVCDIWRGYWVQVCGSAVPSHRALAALAETQRCSLLLLGQASGCLPDSSSMCATPSTHCERFFTNTRPPALVA